MFMSQSTVLKLIGDNAVRKEVVHYLNLVEGYCKGDVKEATRISRETTQEVQEHAIESLSNTVAELLGLYLTANNGNIYLYHWSRDCDCVEGSHVSKHHRKDPEGEGAGLRADEYIELLIARSKGEAEGPASCHLISEKRYNELLESPEPVRDRIAEAWDNGNRSPFSV